MVLVGLEALDVLKLLRQGRQGVQEGAGRACRKGQAGHRRARG